MKEINDLKRKCLSKEFDDFLKEEVKNIMLPNGVSPGIAITYGNAHTMSQFYYGENGDGELLDGDMEFDLASVTKLFVGFVYMYLIENQYISGKEKISDCSTRYRNIGTLLLEDLLSYNVTLETIKRIDSCDNYEEAFAILENVKGKESKVQTYSDLPALILGDILSDFTDKSFKEWVDFLFVERLQLSGLLYAKSFERKYVSYENEYIFSNKGLIRKSNPIGIVNDPKSRILMEREGYLTGNAGLFCSTKDIARICQSILSFDILSFDSLKKMVLGNEMISSIGNQSFGYMCYKKISDKVKSEVPWFASDYAFASSGFTGCYLLIDIFNEVFMFIGGNRLNNLVSKKLIKSDVMNNEFIVNGMTVKSGLEYVYKRDSLRDLVCFKSMLENEDTNFVY